MKNKAYQESNYTNRILWVGGFWSLVALFLFTRTGGLITFDENTGHVGDTIGGILGPALNFTGLIVLIYSLREQFNANNLQRKALADERQKDSQEQALTISIRLVEEAEKFWQAHQFDFTRLLKEEDKIRFDNPAYYDDISHDALDHGDLWAVYKDLQLGAAFLGVFSELAATMTNYQKSFVIAMFDVKYYTPLRKFKEQLEQHHPDQWEDFNHKFKASPPQSRSYNEVLRQLDSFRALKTP